MFFVMSSNDYPNNMCKIFVGDATENTFMTRVNICSSLFLIVIMIGFPRYNLQKLKFIHKNVAHYLKRYLMCLLMHLIL